jgi:hypothetical protein
VNNCTCLATCIPIDNLFLTYMPFRFQANHSINGALPTELSRLVQVSSIELNNNAISGTLPSELGSLRQSLNSIGLARNSLHGTIPPELFVELENLEVLLISRNHLTGSLPTSIRHFSGTSIQLDNNNFSGTLPSGIFSLTKLTLLNLDGNGVSIKFACRPIPFLNSQYTQRMISCQVHYQPK